MTELRPYQHDAILAMRRAGGRAIFAYAPGTGKTGTVARWLLGEVREIAEAGTNWRVLIVAPNGPVLQHWESELMRFAGLPGIIGTGSPKKRAKWRESVAMGGYLPIIVNYETMRGDIDELLKIPWDAVVFDESHRLKNRKSLTFKAAAKLARRTERVMLVTGTPILNRAEELWTSMHLLEPTRYKSFWRWAEHHFTIENKRYAGRLVREVGELKPGHAKLLREELGHRLIQKPLSELLPDLPQVETTYLSTTLSAAERRSYDSMLENFWMVHGDELIIADNKIAQMSRLRQLASDWSVFHESGGRPLGAKGIAAVSLCEDLEPEQVVIFCAYRSTVGALVEAIPGSVGYHGGLVQHSRDMIIKAFKHGVARVLIGTIGTMAEGIDGMQVARNVIFVDRDWTPARNEQAVARLQRSGQMSSVNVVHLVAENTIDQVVAAALARKQSVIDAVLGSRGRSAVHSS